MFVPIFKTCVVLFFVLSVLPAALYRKIGGNANINSFADLLSLMFLAIGALGALGALAAGNAGRLASFMGSIPVIILAALAVVCRWVLPGRLKAPG